MSAIDNLSATGPLQPISDAEVDRAEAAVGVRFPAGYRGFITTYGRGIVGGLIRIYSPADILSGDNSVTEWRKRIDEYWFWDEGPLPKARALECIIIGDTVGGDEIVFHPSAPDALYVLPHDFEESYAMGEGLGAAATWLFSSGVLDAPFEDKSFAPY